MPCALCLVCVCCLRLLAFALALSHFFVGARATHQRILIRRFPHKSAALRWEEWKNLQICILILQSRPHFSLSTAENFTCNIASSPSYSTYCIIRRYMLVPYTSKEECPIMRKVRNIPGAKRQFRTMSQNEERRTKNKEFLSY